MLVVVASIGACLVSFIAFLYFADEVVKYFAELVGLNFDFEVGCLFFKMNKAQYDSSSITLNFWLIVTNDFFLFEPTLPTLYVFSDYFLSIPSCD